MNALVALVKPILFSFLTSKAVKDLVVELLEKYVRTTDNQIDDALVMIVKEKLYTHQ
jgi:hypothetical protein